MKAKKALPWLLFAVAFAAAMTFATFYDYGISVRVAVLENGAYLSPSAFGRFFETVGEHALYLVGATAAGVLFYFCVGLANKPLRWIFSLLCFALAVLAYDLMITRSAKYVVGHLGKESAYQSVKGLFEGIALGFSFLLAALTVLLEGKIPAGTRGKLFGYGLTVIFTVILSQIVVQTIKIPIGRQRFRAIYVLTENGLAAEARYTRWYVINGARQASEAMRALGLTSDAFKSCPSGHTCSAGTVFALCTVPGFLGMEGKKKKMVTAALWIFAFGYTALVGYSRMVMGAHFLSDVLLGGTLTLLASRISLILAEKIVKTLAKRKKM